MAGKLEGKVAFITGGARGQGRSHAVKLASEGADVVLFDIARDLETVDYEMASPADLDETVSLVEAQGRKALAIQGDVRNLREVEDAIKQTVDTFGGLDIALANAGVAAYKNTDVKGWAEVLGINLTGVMNTINTAVTVMKPGGSAVATGSFAALMKGGVGGAPGGQAYSYAKRDMINYVARVAAAVGPLGIRVNGVHPTNCNTRLLMNDGLFKIFRPDLENPTLEDAKPALATMQLLPDVPYIEPEDISNAIAFLVSEDARYITGQFLAVDAGAHLKLLE